MDRLDEALKLCEDYIFQLESHTDQDGRITGPDFNFTEIEAVREVMRRIDALRGHTISVEHP